MKLSCYGCEQTDKLNAGLCKDCGAYMHDILISQVPDPHMDIWDIHNRAMKKIRNEMKIEAWHVCIVLYRMRKNHDLLAVSAFASRIMQFLHNFEPRLLITAKEQTL
jgi:hypothetical protein